MTLLSIMASDSDVGIQSELQLQFGPDVQFSVKLNKLFIQRLETLTVKFKRLDLGTSPDRIKAHLSFSDYNDKLVQTCYAHKTSMKDFPEHVLQCLNSEAMHVNPPKCKQFSCFCPLSWSRDCVWSEAHLFRFVCNTSCVGGPNRRAMKLHFVAKRGNADLTEACVRVQVCPNPFQLCQREEKEKELEDKETLLKKEAEPPPEIESASEAEPPPETEAGSTSEAEPPPDMEAESVLEAVPPPETGAESASEAEPPPETEAESTSEAEPPPETEAESTSEAEPPPETEAESASEAEPPPETEVEGHSEDIFSSGSEYLPSPKKRKQKAQSAFNSDSCDGDSGDEYQPTPKKRKQLEGSEKNCKKIRYSSCDRRVEKPGMEKAQSDGPPKKGRLSTPRHRKQTAKNPRKRFKCPIAGCPAETVHVQRHMRKVHKNIPDFQSKLLCQKSRGTSKRKYLKKSCTFPDCSWFGTRPEKHFLLKHGVQTRNEALSMAKGCPLLHSNKSERSQVRHGLHTADSLSHEFLNWYSSMEGGSYIDPALNNRKRKKTERQNVRTQTMIKCVLTEYFGKGSFPIESLARLQTLARDEEEESVLSKLKKNKTWGTLKNYLVALGHFVTFITVNYPHKDIDSTALRQVFARITKTVNKKVGEELQTRKVDVQDKLLSAEFIKAYLDEKMAKKLITKIKEKGSKTTEDFKNIRNHLLIQTAFQNAKRTGILSEMTEDHVFKAKTVGQKRIVIVGEGKTFRSCGAAKVQFNESNYKHLCYFIKHIKPQSEEGQVFCAEDGSFATDLNPFIQKGLEHFHCETKIVVPHVTCSLLRKSWVTITRESGMTRDEQRLVAKHMDHDITTADRNYDISTGLKETAFFGDLVSRFVPHNDTTDGSSSDSSTHLEPLEIETSKLSKNKQGKNCMFGKELVFSEHHIAKLKSCCNEYIQEKCDGGKMKRSDVIGLIQRAGPNFQCLLDSYSPLQLYNRVRTEVLKANKRLHLSKDEQSKR